MFRNALKACLKKLLAVVGLEIRRVSFSLMARVRETLFSRFFSKQKQWGSLR